MTKLAYTAILLALTTTAASAQTIPRALQAPADGQPAQLLRVHHEASDSGPAVQMLTSLPSEAWTVTQGYKYDRNAMKWMPENAPATIGGPNPAPRPNPR